MSLISTATTATSSAGKSNIPPPKTAYLIVQQIQTGHVLTLDTKRLIPYVAPLVPNESRQLFEWKTNKIISAHSPFIRNNPDDMFCLTLGEDNELSFKALEKFPTTVTNDVEQQDEAERKRRLMSAQEWESRDGCILSLRQGTTISLSVSSGRDNKVISVKSKASGWCIRVVQTARPFNDLLHKMFLNQWNAVNIVRVNTNEVLCQTTALQPQQLCLPTKKRSRRGKKNHHSHRRSVHAGAAYGKRKEFDDEEEQDQSFSTSSLSGSSSSYSDNYDMSDKNDYSDEEEEEEEFHSDALAGAALDLDKRTSKKYSEHDHEKEFHYRALGWKLQVENPEKARFYISSVSKMGQKTSKIHYALYGCELNRKGRLLSIAQSSYNPKFQQGAPTLIIETRDSKCLLASDFDSRIREKFDQYYFDKDEEESGDESHHSDDDFSSSSSESSDDEDSFDWESGKRRSKKHKKSRRGKIERIRQKDIRRRAEALFFNPEYRLGGIRLLDRESYRPLQCVSDGIRVPNERIYKYRHHHASSDLLNLAQTQENKSSSSLNSVVVQSCTGANEPSSENDPPCVDEGLFSIGIVESDAFRKFTSSVPLLFRDDYWYCDDQEVRDHILPLVNNDSLWKSWKPCAEHLRIVKPQPRPVTIVSPLKKDNQKECVDCVRVTVAPARPYAPVIIEKKPIQKAPQEEESRSFFDGVSTTSLWVAGLLLLATICGIAWLVFRRKKQGSRSMDDDDDDEDKEEENHNAANTNRNSDDEDESEDSSSESDDEDESTDDDTSSSNENSSSTRSYQNSFLNKQ